MNKGIQFYNMHWEDLTKPTFEMAIRICQVMHHVVVQGGPDRQNKILVHCHAGQGRTAIIIGSYLLYSGIAKTAKEAIEQCKAGRPKLFGGISYNLDFMYMFEQRLKESRMLYPQVGSSESLLNILKK